MAVRNGRLPNLSLPLSWNPEPICLGGFPLQGGTGLCQKLVVCLRGSAGPALISFEQSCAFESGSRQPWRLWRQAVEMMPISLDCTPHLERGRLKFATEDLSSAMLRMAGVCPALDLTSNFAIQAEALVQVRWHRQEAHVRVLANPHLHAKDLVLESHCKPEAPCLSALGECCGLSSLIRLRP